MRRIHNLIVYIVFLIVFVLLFSFLEDDNNDNKFIDKIHTEINGDLVVYFIDVGEADATLISNNGHYMLVDAGNNEDGKLLVNYFKSLGIKKFDYLVCTHPHEDHIGGMDNLIREFEVDKFFIPSVEVEYMSYTEVIKLLKEKNIPIEEPSIDSIIDIGNSKAKFLFVDKNYEEINDSSIVLKIYYGDTSLIITGDASYNVENKLLEKDLSSDVLRVGHHGSRYASSAKFLHEVNPKYSIISVGKDNEYGHPHKVTLDKLNRINSKIYRTDEDGTIIMTSNGKNILFKTEKTNTNGD